MFTIHFKAGFGLKEWKHKKSLVYKSTYGGVATTKVSATPKWQVIHDGEEFEVDKFDRDWLLSNYPVNFSVVLGDQEPVTEPEEESLLDFDFDEE